MANDRITNFKLRYDLVDTSALDDCVISSEDTQDFSDIENLKEREPFPQYMTWEHNYNILDGSLTHFQESTYTTNNIGFFSTEISDEDGLFTNNPSLLLTFEDSHTTIGLTLYFIGDYPLEVTITWYSTGVELISNSYNITNNVMFIDQAVSMFDEIKLEFTKALPNRYVKLYGLLFGKAFDWDETTIKSGNLVQEMNILMDKLSINTLTFEIVDLDNTLNFGNTANIIEYFTRTQSMYPSIAINDTNIELGKYYLESVVTDNNIAKFTAYSAIYLLENVQFNEGQIYNGTLAGVVLTQIFGLAGITDYYIDPTTYNIPLYGTIKPCTCKDALQKILFVCGSIIRTNSTEYQVIIEQPSTSLNTRITRANKISTKVSDLEYVTGVTLSYTVYSEETSESTISIDTYDAGTHFIIFSAPYTDIRLSDSSITIEKSSTYYVQFTTTTETELSIYGVAYKATTNNISLNRTVIKSGAIENVKTFSTELCDYLRASRLTYNLLNYYISSSLNIEIKTLAADNEMTGKQIVYNTVSTLNNYVGRYSSRVFDLTGGFIDSSKLIGYYSAVSSNEYFTTTFENQQDMYAGDYLI